MCLLRTGTNVSQALKKELYLSIIIIVIIPIFIIIIKINNNNNNNIIIIITIIICKRKQLCKVVYSNSLPWISKLKNTRMFR